MSQRHFREFTKIFSLFSRSKGVVECNISPPPHAPTPTHIHIYTIRISILYEQVDRFPSSDVTASQKDYLVLVSLTQFWRTLFYMHDISWIIGKNFTKLVLTTQHRWDKHKSRPRGYKTFFCSTQLSMKFFKNAHKYKNIKKFGLFKAQLSLECYFSRSYMLKCQQLLAL